MTQQCQTKTIKRKNLEEKRELTYKRKKSIICLFLEGTETVVNINNDRKNRKKKTKKKD